MDAAGIIVDEDEEKPKAATAKKRKETSEGFKRYSIKELEDLLVKAVEKEEYEKASKIRDEIQHKKGENK